MRELNYEDYLSHTRANLIPAAEINYMLEDSLRVLELYTGRALPDDWDIFDELCDAVCVEADYIYEFLPPSLYGGRGGRVLEQKAGDFSVKYGNDGCVRLRGMPFSPVARSIIDRLGLYSRLICTEDEE